MLVHITTNDHIAFVIPDHHPVLNTGIFKNLNYSQMIDIDSVHFSYLLFDLSEKLTFGELLKHLKGIQKFCLDYQNRKCISRLTTIINTQYETDQFFDFIRDYYLTDLLDYEVLRGNLTKLNLFHEDLLKMITNSIELQWWVPIIEKRAVSHSVDFNLLYEIFIKVLDDRIDDSSEMFMNIFHNYPLTFSELLKIRHSELREIRSKMSRIEKQNLFDKFWKLKQYVGSCLYSDRRDMIYEIIFDDFLWILKEKENFNLINEIIIIKANIKELPKTYSYNNYSVIEEYLKSLILN